MVGEFVVNNLAENTHVICFHFEANLSEIFSLEKVGIISTLLWQYIEPNIQDNQKALKIC